MSISIYYTARRACRLTEPEQGSINELVARYSIDDLIEEYLRTGVGWNWESFSFYDANEPSELDVILEGSTKLPDNNEEAFWQGLQHWCNLLSEIRRILPNTSWAVQLEDREISWNEATQLFGVSH
jgi:hypothetical protein